MVWKRDSINTENLQYQVMKKHCTLKGFLLCVSLKKWKESKERKKIRKEGTNKKN